MTRSVEAGVETVERVEVRWSKGRISTPAGEKRVQSGTCPVTNFHDHFSAKSKRALVCGIVRRAHDDSFVVFNGDLNVNLARTGTAVGHHLSKRPGCNGANL